MTTAQDVFSAAMGLMDEVSETTGATDYSDTAEYKNRTLLILNVIAGELFPYSDNFEVTEDGKRPICSIISNFSTPIGLDDYCCRTVMPYGLAAHLLLDENPSVASFFNQKYDELKATLARGLPKTSEDIVDVYGCSGNGGIPWEYNTMGAW